MPLASQNGGNIDQLGDLSLNHGRIQHARAARGIPDFGAVFDDVDDPLDHEADALPS